MKHPLLAKRYAGEAWAYFEEVSNGTGYAKRRKAYCDAIALSLYPSRGIHLHGHEVKASRSDWLRELKDPGKADEIARYCHYWWIVADAEGIVKVEELPPTWGLLEGRNARGGRELRVVKQAPLAEPMPMDPFFVAALARSTARTMEGSVPRREHEALQRELDKRARDLFEEEREEMRKAVAQAQRDVLVAKDELRQFKVKFGVGYNDTDLLERAIPFALQIVRYPWGASRLRSTLEKFLAAAHSIEALVNELEEMAPPPDATVEVPALPSITEVT